METINLNDYFESINYGKDLSYDKDIKVTGSISNDIPTSFFNDTIDFFNDVIGGTDKNFFKPLPVFDKIDFDSLNDLQQINVGPITQEPINNGSLNQFSLLGSSSTFGPLQTIGEQPTFGKLPTFGPIPTLGSSGSNNTQLPGSTLSNQNPLSVFKEQMNLQKTLANQQLEYLKQKDNTLLSLQKDILEQQKELALKQLQEQINEFNKMYSLQKEQFDWQRTYQQTLLNQTQAEYLHQQQVRDAITRKFKS